MVFNFVVIVGQNVIPFNGRLHVVESQLIPSESTHCHRMAFAICNMLAVWAVKLHERLLKVRTQ